MVICHNDISTILFLLGTLGSIINHEITEGSKFSLQKCSFFKAEYVRGSGGSLGVSSHILCDCEHTYTTIYCWYIDVVNMYSFTHFLGYFLSIQQLYLIFLSIAYMTKLCINIYIMHNKVIISIKSNICKEVCYRRYSKVC